MGVPGVRRANPPREEPAVTARDAVEFTASLVTVVAAGAFLVFLMCL